MLFHLMFVEFDLECVRTLFGLGERSVLMFAKQTQLLSSSRFLEEEICLSHALVLLWERVREKSYVEKR